MLSLSMWKREEKEKLWCFLSDEEEKKAYAMVAGTLNKYEGKEEGWG